MEECYKFNAKPNIPITDWNDTNITTKMESISKLIANECFSESKKLGGIEYNFTVEDITLADKNIGTVEIKWKIK